MGFYGTSGYKAASTNLTIDKTYGSRWAMEVSMAHDGIFLGRNVLIEYEHDDSNSGIYLSLYGLRQWDGYLYITEGGSSTSRVMFQEFPSNWNKTIYYPDTNRETPIVYRGQIVQYKYQSSNANWMYARCTGADANGYALFDTTGLVVTETDERKRKYDINSNVDYKVGYTNSDSTVCQKTYVNNTEKYLDIANLNATFPDLAISALAPSEDPVKPGFSETSGGAYYNIQMPTMWGFEIGDIDFNANGLDSTKKNTITNGTNSIIVKKESSGTSYIDGVKDDTYVLDIKLPGVGDAVAKVYDVLYGTERDNGSDSLQYQINMFKTLPAQTIPVAVQEGVLKGASLSGDSWIGTAVNTINPSNSTITISHKNTVAPSSDDIIYGNNTTGTIQPSGNIKVPKINIDDKGHVNKIEEMTLTLPTVGVMPLTGYSANTNDTLAAEDTVNQAFKKLSQQILTETSNRGTAITNLTNTLNTTKSDLQAEIDADVAAEATARNTAINTAVSQEATDRAAAITSEAQARENADNALSGRIQTLESAPAAGITAANITSWSNAEANVQADWNVTNTSSDAYIKNKPTDLVRTADIADVVRDADIANMVVKSDITNMVETSDITDVVRTGDINDVVRTSDITDVVRTNDINNVIRDNTTFLYTPAVMGEDGLPTAEAVNYTIAQLVTKVKALEDRIAILENTTV